MEQQNTTASRFATTEEIQCAIESLSKLDTARLKKAAYICLGGTEYQDAFELINESVSRAIAGTRPWPKAVPFMAFMIMTIKGIASDSRESNQQTKTDHLEVIAGEDANAETALDILGYSTPSITEQVIEFELSEEHLAKAQSYSDAVDEHFARDDEVNWIIMGIKDDQSAKNIRELSGMSNTQYDTARKRFRRGLEKIFSIRRET